MCSLGHFRRLCGPVVPFVGRPGGSAAGARDTREALPRWQLAGGDKPGTYPSASACRAGWAAMKAGWVAASASTRKMRG